MSILEYVLSGAFLILLLLYIIKTVIDNRFRAKTVDYMKNQKKTIQSLEEEKENFSDKNRELKSEIAGYQNQLDKLKKDYAKISVILENGIEDQSKKFTAEVEQALEGKSISKQQKEKISRELEAYSNQMNNMISWYQSVYGDNEPEKNVFEITEATQSVINDVTRSFQYKKITFINHIGEPLNVTADQNMITYVISAIATLLATRSVNGNTMYVDVERTGRKCLVTFEDSGPGDKDEVIKDIIGEKYMEERIKTLKDAHYISLMMARDLVEKNGGKIWASAIMEVGIKLSFSIPLD